MQRLDLRWNGFTQLSVSLDGSPHAETPDAVEATALQVLRLCESLEDDDDVQNVYSNLDIADELLARLPA